MLMSRKTRIVECVCACPVLACCPGERGRPTQPRASSALYRVQRQMGPPADLTLSVEFSQIRVYVILRHVRRARARVRETPYIRYIRL